MYSLKFIDFQNGNYDEKIDSKTSIYLVRDDQKILYIGYSDSGIWNRWFASGIVAHLQQNIYGQWYGQTLIGEEILKNKPQSDNWGIDLFTRDECLEKYVLYAKVKEAVPTHWIEAEMIHSLQPKLNVNNK